MSGGVPELVDGHDLGSCAERRGGSSPPFPTTRNSSRTISPGYDSKGSIEIRPGYFPIFYVETLQDSFAKQALLIKVPLLEKKIKLCSQFKSHFKISSERR